MKEDKNIHIGDLVQCTWQPDTCRVVKRSDGKEWCVPMTITIKGQLGIVLEKHHGLRWRILFPQLYAYTHVLCDSAFELVSERDNYANR